MGCHYDPSPEGIAGKAVLQTLICVDVCDNMIKLGNLKIEMGDGLHRNLSTKVNYMSHCQHLHKT